MAALPEFEPEPGIYIPSVSDLACLDALKLDRKKEVKDSLREIDPVLWARGKIAMRDGRYAGQVSDEELIENIENSRGTPDSLLTEEEIAEHFIE